MKILTLCQKKVEVNKRRMALSAERSREVTKTDTARIERIMTGLSSIVDRIAVLTSIGCSDMIE